MEGSDKDDGLCFSPLRGWYQNQIPMAANNTKQSVTTTDTIFLFVLASFLGLKGAEVSDEISSGRREKFGVEDPKLFVMTLIRWGTLGSV
mmetsp:Transcript_26904/g.62503  ORF Transcript_26904/g.62503 Transcript_26904/m.62503 type:complete len:90 (-) Transcript_26904:22-291(-)